METNKVYNIDCLSFMRTLPDKCVDLIVTDPPYNFESQGGGFYGATGCYTRKYTKVLKVLKKNSCTEYNPIDYLNESKRILKKFNAIFFCNKSLINNYLSWAIENELLYDIHVMAKQNPIPAKKNHFLNDLEYIIYLKESGAYFNLKTEYDFYRKFYLTTCKQDNFHPAQKPIEIIKKYILILSEENDIIFDGYMGSGTTAVACKQLNRQYIGCEINPDYCKIIEQRLSQGELFNQEES
jgi:DNA modification methylase